MSDENKQLAERFINELWNDKDLSWADQPAASSEIVSHSYRPGYSGTLHWSWRPGSVELTGAGWLERQVRRYRAEYPDFELEVKHLLTDDDHVVTALHFNGGGHATRTFTDRGGNDVPVRHSANGIGWTHITDGRITRHGMFWEIGTFLGGDD